MNAGKHESLVEDQFGPQAAAYVASAVHAEGEDLRQLAGIARTRPQARALDLGCGGGHVSFNVAPAVGEVVAYDLSRDMLAAVEAEAARRGLTNIVTQAGPVEHLPFEAASFDLVFSRFSAHHWSDFRAGMREARRVLRPGGLAAFADVVAAEDALLDTHLQTIEMLRDPSHVRDYSIEQWRQAARDAGFAPGAVTRRRLRIDFASWIGRMSTPDLHVQAIRSLQARMAEPVQRHFEIEADGSFMLDTMTLEATPA